MNITIIHDERMMAARCGTIIASMDVVNVHGFGHANLSSIHSTGCVPYDKHEQQTETEACLNENHALGYINYLIIWTQLSVFYSFLLVYHGLTAQMCFKFNQAQFLSSQMLPAGEISSVLCY